jgi:nucleotide-binding universal stress UspA family protein
VWVVRPGRSHPDLKRIVCAIDGSQPAREALATAAFLARNFVADLTLLTVVGTARHAGGGALAALTREVDLHGIEVMRVLREGKPAQRIVEVAEETAADLLVLGSAGRTGLSRLILGRNTAEQVIRKLPTSLLAVPAPMAQ